MRLKFYYFFFLISQCIMNIIRMFSIKVNTNFLNVKPNTYLLILKLITIISAFPEISTATTLAVWLPFGSFAL